MCIWNATEQNGVKGWIVTGIGAYAPASIFLPYAGDGYGTSLSYAGLIGYYWSSVPLSDYGNDAWLLYFHSGEHNTSTSDRYGGQSVRPVQGFTE